MRLSKVPVKKSGGVQQKGKWTKHLQLEKIIKLAVMRMRAPAGAYHPTILTASP